MRLTLHRSTERRAAHHPAVAMGATPVPEADRLSVLHVLAPAPVGGLESVVRLLALGQREQGHLVRIAAIVGPEEAERHPFLSALATMGIEVVAVVVAGRAYRREWREVRALCERFAPDVVHTHGYRADLVAARAARSAGVPTVTTLHGFTGGDWRNNLYEALQRWSLRHFDAVVSVSRPLAERVRAYVGGELAVVPNGIARSPAVFARDDARQLLGIPREARRVGWIGRFGWEKGADVMIAALAGLGDTGVTLSLVGQGSEEQGLRRLSEQLGVASRLQWHGRVAEAGRLLAAFDVVVLSSRTEGTPMVLLEAMAAGIPVVATRVGGIPDVVSDREALIVPPERPDALADAVRRLFNEPGSTAMRAQAARQRVIDHYALESWIDSYESIYRRCALRRAAALSLPS